MRQSKTQNNGHLPQCAVRQKKRISPVGARIALSFF
jgi:hypothetical protein